MKTLLIYYGFPSCINMQLYGAQTPAEAAAQFDRYDYLILGDGLELPDHPDHENTRLIVSMLTRPTVFGYVDLGVTTQNLSFDEIEDRSGMWADMGAGGVFYDDAGSDFGVSAERQRQAINMAHGPGMLACVNCWNPADIDPKADFALAESWAVQDSRQVPWRRRGRQLAKAGPAILSVATGQYTPARMRRAYQAALRFQHEAFGWGEPDYSADGNAPWRPRPKEKP